MAMGKRRKTSQQQEIWVETRKLPRSAGHPLYERLNSILEEDGFDAFVEGLCAKFYAKKMGRPSIAPGVYFRMFLIGYLEGLGSDRGIAWRTADSISLRSFLGLALTDSTPDHSTISRTRRLLDEEVHDEVSCRVQAILARNGLLPGKTIGVDATTLEANAAMRSIERRDTGESYPEFVRRLASESGIEDPTREDVAKFDRGRRKSTSNKDWEHPHDPDAKVTKMKDGRTHMAHKAEHAIDMESGAIVAITVQPADRGDTSSIHYTLDLAERNLQRLQDDSVATTRVSNLALSEIVADKGYHSNDVLTGLQEDGIRTYISEPDRGRRNWKNKDQERSAVYSNRRRIRGSRGRELMRDRGEKIERSFAHCYETGGMRRTHIRGHENIAKRLLIHAAAFNLSLLLRREFGFGTPRGFRAPVFMLMRLLGGLLRPLRLLWRTCWRSGVDMHRGSVEALSLP